MNRTLRLFYSGLAIWALLVIEIAAAYAWDADLGQGMLIGIGAEVFTGRESGIPTALAAGVPPVLVAQLSAMQDIGSALLVYPLFLAVLHRYHDADNYVMRRLRAFEERAQERERRRRWGPVAIGLFMLVPFLVNGPMVGLIIGRLAGLYTRVVLPAVIIATVVAASLWTFFFDAMIGLVERVHPQAGIFIAGAMVVVVLVLAIWDHRRESLRSDE